MRPIDFPESNTIFAKHQGEYVSLPAFYDYSNLDGERHFGRVVHCWKLSWRERLRVILSGRMWVQVLTFEKPLQPVRLATEKPLMPVQLEFLHSAPYIDEREASGANDNHGAATRGLGVSDEGA